MLRSRASVECGVPPVLSPVSAYGHRSLTLAYCIIVCCCYRGNNHLSNILPCLRIYFSAYGRRSYSLLRYWINVARISWSLSFCSASCLVCAFCRRLIFLAFLSWFLVWGNGFTWLRCQVMRALVDCSINRSALSSTWSARWSSVRSLGVEDTSRSLGTWWILLEWSGNTAGLRISHSNLSLGISSGSSTEVVPRSWRLSIWTIIPCSRPITDASHQTQWATKTCWVLLA
jgi:hypothetical protein